LGFPRFNVFAGGPGSLAERSAAGVENGAGLEAGTPESMAKHSWSKGDTLITLGLFGGTVGAAGWIFGVAIELLSAPAPPAGIHLDILMVCLGAVAVLITGVFVWCLYLSGRRLRVAFIIETLLGASLVFGTLALMWIHARGVLTLAVRGYGGSGQPGNEVWEAIGRDLPPEFAYAAPLLILGLMALIWWPRSRKRLLGSYAHVQRGTRQGEQPGQLL
jgi:hypothetical protein